MGKGEQTRQAILEQAAQVFNVHGYSGTAMSELMRQTGLTKGGIYNHFGSKEALALEAFDFAVGAINGRFREVLAGRTRAIDRLMATVEIFRSLIEEPLTAGGCPILNTAIEADDVHPALRERARQAMSGWHEFIARTARKGITVGELRPETDPEALATIITATLEGAVMLSKLYGDTTHMERAVDHLGRHLQSLEGERGRGGDR
jgi:TetR/AcrR family transcriptional regulator, transcriptional repressor for nem operon